jgi:hypothetical protein
MMKTVKAEWDKAPAGPKKDAALKHYQAAEAALKAHNERGCIAAPKSAGSALTWFGACDPGQTTAAADRERSAGEARRADPDQAGLTSTLPRWRSNVGRLALARWWVSRGGRAARGEHPEKT